MNTVLLSIDRIVSEAREAINKADDLHTLEQIRSQFLGKKGTLTDALKGLANIELSERPKIGAIINSAKENIAQLLTSRADFLKDLALQENLAAETIDVTLPPRGQETGSLHPITKVQKILEDFFIGMGFVIAEGPEVEDDFHNFTALNIPPHHPARAGHDTFYFANGLLLRTQTSPVQIRAMQTMKPPLRIICPGRVFRRDNDATHAPMFNQMEMLIIDENVNFANLKWLIVKFIEYFFKGNIEYRFRPSFFPFTEPSAEIDIKWVTGDSWRWLELGGCGVVHPNVLKAGGIDPKRYRGLAFGFGIDRLAMSYYGIKDIRMLFESDLQFLQQF